MKKKKKKETIYARI